jgi:hypothetical protein
MVKLAKNGAAKCQKIQKNERVFLLHQSFIFWVVAQVIAKIMVFKSSSLKIWCYMLAKGMKPFELLNLLGLGDW